MCVCEYEIEIENNRGEVYSPLVKNGGVKKGGKKEILRKIHAKLGVQEMHILSIYKEYRTNERTKSNKNSNMVEKLQ